MKSIITVSNSEGFRNFALTFKKKNQIRFSSYKQIRGFEIEMPLNFFIILKRQQNENINKERELIGIWVGVKAIMP